MLQRMLDIGQDPEQDFGRCRACRTLQTKRDAKPPQKTLDTMLDVKQGAGRWTLKGTIDITQDAGRSTGLDAGQLQDAGANAGYILDST